MTREDYFELKEQFEGGLNEFIFESRKRELNAEDFKMIRWIVHNLDVLRNHDPEELGFDMVTMKVYVLKK